ncbi:MAG: DUF2029 domain-containing protein [Bacteroidetes bacterium]|nr:DUF2029 domain-containing protein [Bacteroidota bacterium]
MQTFKRIQSFILQYKILAILYVLALAFGYWQLLEFNQINNFKIFRASTHHFLKGLPLYIEYPNEYFDLFYYNPTFPVFFMPFALLPIKAGMLAWMSFTMLVCFIVYKNLPMNDEKNKVLILLMLFDMLNNITHTQTNPLFLAFMLATWIMMDRGKPFWAAMFAVLSFLVKGYGGIIGIICLYYKNWYKAVLYSILWFVVLNALMLFFISPQMVIQYYTDWLHIISSDTIKESYSIYGLFTKLHINIAETYVLLLALATLVSFIALQYIIKDRKREHIVAFLLIWVIVFNRASEPATYIIAIAGVIIWHLSRPKNMVSTTLFWATLLISTLIPTDIIRVFDKIRYEYYLKSILCLLIIGDMFAYSIQTVINNKKQVFTQR